MTREEAKEYLMDISYQLGTIRIEYLSEKDGEKMREAINALEQEPCGDNECDFCSEHEVDDVLYAMSDYDGGIRFDYVKYIKYCPLCGRKLGG